MKTKTKKKVYRKSPTTKKAEIEAFRAEVRARLEASAKSEEAKPYNYGIVLGSLLLALWCGISLNFIGMVIFLGIAYGVRVK